ncbi:hypothetical protein GSI_07557 [Ganoderma sinense ZZ0214-1]|uniref:F-box domain-containing protein n=1 Tax=Ganoderma sinense ZZ0214-1 TaxID=1077348 RepID=A0A2G8S9E3_9APHY|nr:hypothetical protein GSI_07557 [Ganoderma sinense ZZ0214-1]
MDKCPNEVLALIFAEACTDDGLAGRSLSLVSRRVHDISRRHALQSVALYGFYQLSTFASLLDKSDPEDRNIRHLYVSDRPRGWIEYLPGQGREDWLATRVDEHFHFDDPSPNHSTSSLLHILKTVSPTLETLALLLFDRYDKQPLSDALCLPKLRELTLHGSNLTRPDHSELAQCLALRRLHVVQNVSIRGSMTKAVSHLAPLLTHLRISRIVANRFASGDIVLGLESMLQQDDLASTGFPPTLKCVLVQMLRVGTQDRNGRAAVRVCSLL